MVFNNNILCALHSSNKVALHEQLARLIARNSYGIS